MRSIKQTASFKRDLKRESKGQYRYAIKEDFAEIVENLAMDISLEERFRDHSLIGSRSGQRTCHIRPDMLLIYCKPDDATLRLVRLGTHSELFGL